jgi:hypothetical protein
MQPGGRDRSGSVLMCGHNVLHLEIEKFIQPIHFKPTIVFATEINETIGKKSFL